MALKMLKQSLPNLETAKYERSVPRNVISLIPLHMNEHTESLSLYLVGSSFFFAKTSIQHKVKISQSKFLNDP